MDKDKGKDKGKGKGMGKDKGKGIRGRVKRTRETFPDTSYFSRFDRGKASFVFSYLVLFCLI